MNCIENIVADTRHKGHKSCSHVISWDVVSARILRYLYLAIPNMYTSRPVMKKDIQVHGKLSKKDPEFLKAPRLFFDSKKLPARIAAHQINNKYFLGKFKWDFSNRVLCSLKNFWHSIFPCTDISRFNKCQDTYKFVHSSQCEQTSKAW